VETGTSPRASVEADAALLDRITVTQQGETLAVRVGGGGAGEHGGAARASGPAVVTLSTTVLRSVAVSTGARVRVSRMRGQQVALSVTGTGAIDVAAVDADQLQATVVGTGTMTLAGRAGRARLLTNGPGTIDAGALVANDLTVRLDGPGETRARARYTAQVVDTGLGHVEVTGEAKCTVVAPAGGPVECGKAL